MHLIQIKGVKELDKQLTIIHQAISQADTYWQTRIKSVSS